MLGTFTAPGTKETAVRAKKILLQNSTTNVLYVQVMVENDTFIVTLHGRMPLDRCDTVPPKKMASYSVNAAVRRCITPAERLNYTVRNKSGGPLDVDVRPDAKREAIVMTVIAQKN